MIQFYGHKEFLPAVVETSSIKDVEVFSAALSAGHAAFWFFLLLLALKKKHSLASYYFFHKLLKKTPFVTKLCLNVHVSFWCCSAVRFHHPIHGTILSFKKRRYMSSFSPLKSCRKPGLKIPQAESLTTLWKKKKKKKKPKKDAKWCPTDFLICLSDISPGTGAAGPPTSLRRAVLNGATSNRETVTASVWCWPTVTTGGGEAINQTSEGGGSSWGCGGSSQRAPQGRKGVAVNTRAAWTLVRAWGEPPWNAGFKSKRAKQATVLLGNNKKKYFMAYKYQRLD